MNATQQLDSLRQSFWLGDIRRDLLHSGTSERYINQLPVTELTSNPTSFDQAVKNGAAHDVAVCEKGGQRKTRRSAFFRASAGRHYSGMQNIELLGSRRGSAWERWAARNGGGELRRRPDRLHPIVLTRAASGDRGSFPTGR